MEIRRILSHIGWPIRAPEFDPPYELPYWDVCQLLSWTEDGFPDDTVQIQSETGPDLPFIESCSDPPHWED